MDNEVLEDLLSPKAQFAPRDNLLAFFRFLLNNPNVEIREQDGMLRWLTRIPGVPWFNGVLADREAGVDEHASIQENMDYFRQHGIDEMSWWLPAVDTENGWDAQLRSRGFFWNENEPGMGVYLPYLLGMESRSAEWMPEGSYIKQISDKADMQTWVQTFLAGYGAPLDLGEVFYQFIVGMGLDLPARNFLGYLEDRPVATSTMFLGAGVAGIYCVATLEEFRRRGMGTAMTLAPLLQACEMGYLVGVLQSSEMGFPVYQRIGFETTCRIGHYVKKI